MGPYNSSGSNLKGLRYRGLHKETKLVENKQPWPPVVFPEIWKLGVTSSPPIKESPQEETPKFFYPHGSLCL